MFLFPLHGVFPFIFCFMLHRSLQKRFIFEHFINILCQYHNLKCNSLEILAFLLYNEEVD